MAAVWMQFADAWAQHSSPCVGSSTCASAGEWGVGQSGGGTGTEKVLITDVVLKSLGLCWTRAGMIDRNSSSVGTDKALQLFGPDPVALQAGSGLWAVCC